MNDRRKLAIAEHREARGGDADGVGRPAGLAARSVGELWGRSQAVEGASTRHLDATGLSDLPT